MHNVLSFKNRSEKLRGTQGQDRIGEFGTNETKWNALRMRIETVFIAL